MQWSNGAKSLGLFGLSVLFLLLLTSFESLLSGLSLGMEKIISAVLLVMPALAGTAFGLLAILRREAKFWIGALGVLLNTLFAAFFIFLLSFAG